MNAGLAGAKSGGKDDEEMLRMLQQIREGMDGLGPSDVPADYAELRGQKKMLADRLAQLERELRDALAARDALAERERLSREMGELLNRVKGELDESIHGIDKTAALAALTAKLEEGVSDLRTKLTAVEADRVTLLADSASKSELIQDLLNGQVESLRKLILAAPAPAAASGGGDGGLSAAQQQALLDELKAQLARADKSYSIPTIEEMAAMRAERDLLGKQLAELTGLFEACRAERDSLAEQQKLEAFMEILLGQVRLCSPSTTVRPQLLFALNYCLPSTTVCPQLFALNYCLPSTHGVPPLNRSGRSCRAWTSAACRPARRRTS